MAGSSGKQLPHTSHLQEISKSHLINIDSVMAEGAFGKSFCLYGSAVIAGPEEKRPHVMTKDAPATPIA